MAADLLKEFEPDIEQITLVPSEGGRFEVTVNDRLVFSKQASARHAHPGEVMGLVRSFLKDLNNL